VYFYEEFFVLERKCLPQVVNISFLGRRILHRTSTMPSLVMLEDEELDWLIGLIQYCQRHADVNKFQATLLHRLEEARGISRLLHRLKDSESREVSCSFNDNRFCHF
jgi:hypothetical protein